MTDIRDESESSFDRDDILRSTVHICKGFGIQVGLAYKQKHGLLFLSDLSFDEGVQMLENESLNDAVYRCVKIICKTIYEKRAAQVIRDEEPLMPTDEEIEQWVIKVLHYCFPDECSPPESTVRCIIQPIEFCTCKGKENKGITSTGEKKYCTHKRCSCIRAGRECTILCKGCTGRSSHCSHNKSVAEEDAKRAEEIRVATAADWGISSESEDESALTDTETSEVIQTGIAVSDEQIHSEVPVRIETFDNNETPETPVVEVENLTTQFDTSINIVEPVIPRRSRRKRTRLNSETD